MSLTLRGLMCSLGPGGVLTFVLFSVTWLNYYYTVFSTNSATLICQQHVCKIVQIDNGFTETLDP